MTAVNTNQSILSRAVLVLLVSIIIWGLATPSHAEFKLVPTLRLLKDAHMLASAARQLARVTRKDLGQHPIADEALRFRKTMKQFIYKVNRYKLFDKNPVTTEIQQDFIAVKKGFKELRLTIKANYQPEGMNRVRRKFDKVIYRYHRLRHSITVHKQAATGEAQDRPAKPQVVPAQPSPGGPQPPPATAKP